MNDNTHFLIFIILILIFLLNLSYELSYMSVRIIN